MKKSCLFVAVFINGERALLRRTSFTSPPYSSWVISSSIMAAAKGPSFQHPCGSSMYLIHGSQYRVRQLFCSFILLILEVVHLLLIQVCQVFNIVSFFGFFPMIALYCFELHNVVVDPRKTCLVALAVQFENVLLQHLDYQNQSSACLTLYIWPLLRTGIMIKAILLMVAADATSIQAIH